ncbi:unnamed protein product [Periconia digitata]|uniref:Zn(2)-C6 fungal-type domain-containing protein n=1 Tax=Periconia digitata TaxID=1303443 RepID=A0A9W4XFP0_9PLEO|nr:unnamed protein product [Periconia digitata]
MAGNAVEPKRRAKRGTKVKSGCATCRIRKIKCDEDRPFCQKCVKTGRTCEGYQPPFQIYINNAFNNPNVDGIMSTINLNTARPLPNQITPQDVELLKQYFSIKTLCHTKLFCDEEAKQILQASLTDPTIRHAISSLKALRQDLETCGDGPEAVSQPSPVYQYGLEQYSVALRGLASHLSTPDSKRLKPVLLCCPVLISIEQARKNYTAMAQHMIGGLKIMYEHRTRPYFSSSGKLMPALHGRLPALDVFVVKQFAAPCKFADSPTIAHVTGVLTTPPSDKSSLNPGRSDKSQDLRSIAPNMRTELSSIAAATLKFLDEVPHVLTTEAALDLLAEKTVLLESLESWIVKLGFVQKDLWSTGTEPISVSFLRFFHQTLKVVLLGILHVDSFPGFAAQMHAENDALQAIADSVGERVKDYVISAGISRDVN